MNFQIIIEVTRKKVSRILEIISFTIHRQQFYAERNGLEILKNKPSRNLFLQRNFNKTETKNFISKYRKSNEPKQITVKKNMKKNMNIKIKKYKQVERTRILLV